MCKVFVILSILMASVSARAGGERAASEDWVTNRLTKALAPVAASVVELWDTVGSTTSVVYLATQTLSRVESQAESNRNAIAAIPPPSTDARRLVGSDNTEWIDGVGGRWRITLVSAVTNADQLLIYDSTMSSYGTRVMSRVGSSDQWSVGTHDYDLIQAGDLYAESGFIVQGWEAGMEYMWQLLAAPYDVTTFPKTYAHASNGHTGWVDRVVTYQTITSKWDDVANRSDLAAATNALVQTYLITSNAWLTANYTNQTLSVSVISTNGMTNTVSVGGNNSIDPQATNLLWEALVSGLASKSPKAWGAFTPDGSANPDPSYMTFLNAPATLFASGCAWSSYGTYAVLTSPGTVAYSAGTNGAFRLGPDSTNYFGYVVGGAVTVGAVSDSIIVVGGGTESGFAEIVYAYSGGDYPALWFTPSLSIDFALIASVAWVDNLDGTATATVPATTPAGFWKGTTTANFQNIFESTMPSKFLGGVIGSPSELPVVYDSVITITSGGHTYRVPAQLVE